MFRRLAEKRVASIWEYTEYVINCTYTRSKLEVEFRNFIHCGLFSQSGSHMIITIPMCVLPYNYMKVIIIIFLLWLLLLIATMPLSALLVILCSDVIKY